MLENQKLAKNPLTIIAIFASIAEVAGAVALKFVAPEFLDRISRGTNLSYAAMNAITSLYTLDDPFLREAYYSARRAHLAP